MKLYSIGCPNCKVLEKKLQQEGVSFELITDEKIMQEKGFKSAPILEFDDGKTLNFMQAITWLKQYK